MVANSKSQSGRTALLNSVSLGHTECVRLLLGAGANANVKDHVRTDAYVSIFAELLLFLMCARLCHLPFRVLFRSSLHCSCWRFHTIPTLVDFKFRRST